MRVGLDLLFLVPGRSGGRETYARELVRALRTVEPGLQLTAFVNRETPDRVVHELDAGLQLVRVPVRAANRGQWALGQVALLPVLAARARIDVLHSVANFGPLHGGIPRVLTVHDLLFRRYPQTDSPLVRRGTEGLVAAAARRAGRLITVSAASRDDLVRELAIAPERIEVIPNGVGTTLVQGSPAPSPEALRADHRLGQRPVLLSVGSDLPHKNLHALLRAQALIAREERPVLVLVGSGTDGGELSRMARELDLLEDIRLLGPRGAEELEGLYGLASGLVLASLEEGFGLPVLEAMVRGVPATCSDIPVLREVARDAALLFDPRQPPSIAAAMTRVARDEALAARLRDAGRERAAHFSWSATAQATLACYRHTVAERDRPAGERGRSQAP